MHEFALMRLPLFDGGEESLLVRGGPVRTSQDRAAIDADVVQQPACPVDC